MLTYLIRRLILAFIVLILVTFIIFLFLKMIPGDIAVYILGTDARPEQLEALRHELFLDRPLMVQYKQWLTQAVKGDLGHSIIYREDVTHLIAARLPVTLHLGILSMIITTIFGIGSGTICAIRRGGFLDQVITLFANVGVSIPVFWLGILGIYFFGLELRWLPIHGYTSPFDDFWLSTRKIIMPVFCMAIPGLAFLTRQTRSSILEVVRQDYIRTAWSKGLSERVIIIRHILKNGLIPVITLMGVALGTIIAGSVLVETVFNIPGMGRLIVDATLLHDFVTVQGCSLVIAVTILLANLLVDLTYGWLDPRIRYD